MTDARERMARAMSVAHSTIPDNAAHYYDLADAALAVAREMVKDAVWQLPRPSPQDRSMIAGQAAAHNECRAAALRALGGEP